MAIDTIGDLNLRASELKAQGIEKEASNFLGIGKGIGESIDSGLNSYGISKQRDIDRMSEEEKIEKDRQAKALLESGVKGLSDYAKENGLDVNKYQRLGSMAKDTDGFYKLFELANAESKLKKGQAEGQEFGDFLMSGENIQEDDKYEKFINEAVAKASLIKDPDAQKRANESIKLLEEQKVARNKSKESGATTLNQMETVRNNSIKETSKYNIINESLQGMESALESATNNKTLNKAPSDQIIIFGFNRLLDPESVVREGEYDRSTKGAPLMSQYNAFVDRMSNGGVLDNIGRIAILNAARALNYKARIQKMKTLSPKFKYYKSKGLSDSSLQYALGVNDEDLNLLNNFVGNEEKVTQDMTDKLSEAVNEIKQAEDSGSIKPKKIEKTLEVPKNKIETGKGLGL